MKLLGLAFLSVLALIPALLLWIGSVLVVQQHQRIRHHQPIPALVLTSSLDETVQHHSLGKVSRSYRPLVRYRYEVGGRTYEGAGVTVLDRDGDRTWAEDIVAAHPVGAWVTAYIARHDPTDAYLVREVSAAPYQMLLLAMALVWMLGFFSSRLLARWQDHRAVPTGEGRYLLPERLHRGMARPLLLALAWLGIGGVLPAHQLDLGAHLSPGMWLAYGAFWIAGLVLLWTGIARLRQPFRHVQATLDRPVVALGEAFTFRLDAVLRPGLEIAEGALRLHCVRTRREDDGVAKITLFEETAMERTVALVFELDGRRLSAETSLWIAPTWPAGSPKSEGTPRLDWRIEVVFRTRDQVQIEWVFPFLVVPPKAQ